MLNTLNNNAEVQEFEQWWLPQPKNFTLVENEVHVWLANLDHEIFALPKFLRELSLSERERAQRLRFDHDRRRFVVAKGILRQILGRYLGVAPHDILFSTGASGKPELSRRMPIRHGTMHFNQAHSGYFGIFAFCRGRHVGVDVEEIRPFPDLDQLAEVLFSPGELDRFRRLSQEERNHEFFSGWTIKEAFVKALGQGLTLPLNHFEVAGVGGYLGRIVQNHQHPPRLLDWYVQEIPMSSPFAAAVCAKGEGWKLRCCKW